MFRKDLATRTATQLVALALAACSQAGGPAAGGSGSGATADGQGADGQQQGGSDGGADAGRVGGDLASVEILGDSAATDNGVTAPPEVLSGDGPKTELPKPDVPKVEAGPDVAADTGAPSCVGFCGDQSDDGCYCDPECVDNSDCCPDYEKVCSGGGGTNPGGSCVGKCGGKGTGNCYCDNACKGAGDCCADYDKECGSSGGPGSCAGKCGGKGSGNCYCDNVCKQAGDCCGDFDKECGSTGPVNTCLGKCGGKSAGNCYCDDQCSQAGDCCPDYIQQCKNVKPDASGETSNTDGGPSNETTTSDGGPKPDAGSDGQIGDAVDAAVSDAADASSDVSPADDATTTVDAGPPMTCATATQSADKFFLCAPVATNVGALHGKACTKDSECLYGLCLFGTPVAGYDPKVGVCSKNCGFTDGGAAAACATENTGDKAYVCAIEKTLAAGNTKQDTKLLGVFHMCALACDLDDDCVAANPALPNCLKASTGQLSVPPQGVCAKLP